MTKVKAAICRAFGAPLTIEDVELRAPVAGEIEVALEAVAICHSDISYADGAWGGPLPAVYGHEAAGRITAIGPGVTGLREGDRVVVTLIRACRTCAQCGSGRPTLCEDPTSDAPAPMTLPDGDPLWAAMNCGAFAERVVVDQSQAVVVGDDLAPGPAALLACGVVTGVGAVVNSAGLRPGEDALVIGAGGVGLNAIQGARIAGARRIVAVDLAPEKLDAARQFGATDTVLATDPAPWQRVRAAIGRGVDAVFVSVGVAAAYDSAPNYLAPGGRVVMVGMPASGKVSTYEAGNIAAAGQAMIGSKMGDTVIRRDIPWLVDLYGQGRLKLDELVSRQWRLEEINEAIADTKSGGARRNVIVF
ncbi:oxidoreductase, zinc-binding dehydrogenase family protein [Oceanicola granulosus HTCC2516]|uniref:Oxidoreductase, zinc-binding dehydrogenase family protein n=1 Tax=Oceanicola granulosus (strain ATCC BAA-861 / DSM 15982 / KCTC 12143 / HTCC2516) TaxID=314256 RepID=Q2CEZ6_OCEGH|nr:Zn-dependent alcohol dehydrogenase [Oceanicola granulosus]EAR51214.1 oxidoreductase, zinc-binding dehydrogenase family protein [Oceanicola granulosus HTCC2516]